MCVTERKPCPPVTALVAMVGTWLGACGPAKDEAKPAQAIPTRGQAVSRTIAEPSPIVFRAQELSFRYERGESGAAWPVEPTGGGVGLIDYDGDGDLDLFFAQGVPLPVGTAAPGSAPADVLLQNVGGGRFVDVSASVGLTTKGYGQGVTIADYDGDGDPDVYVTRYGPNTLWRNDGGRFTDATTSAGVGCPLWSLGAAFLDYDGDGDLDLYVANYFYFDPKAAPFDRDPKTGAPDYGMPARFDGEPDVLYRNNGDGTFTDVSRAAGIDDKSRGMGVVAADLDGDGRIDLFVANDVQNNILWRNNGDGTFTDVSEASGVAVNAQGQVEANMGVAHADTDGDGRPDLLVSHFFNEHDTLWRPQAVAGRGWLYQDQTLDAGLGIDSRPLTGWGAVLADFDGDGWPDLVVTCGHIRREPGQTYLYENPPILWRNRGDGRFRNVTRTAGSYFLALHQGRGLATGDLDGDGDLDLVVVHHHAPSVILWNETADPGRFLRVTLHGAGKNTGAIGARLEATIGGRSIVRTIDGGGSYLSSNEPTAHFGLGRASQVDRLVVRWPSGRIESRSDLKAGSRIEWREGEPPR